jgi:hypothetical protein
LVAFRAIELAQSWNTVPIWPKVVNIAKFYEAHSQNAWTMLLPLKKLSEIQNQYILFCENSYSMHVWIFIAIGQMDLILINFKTKMFVPTEQSYTVKQRLDPKYKIKHNFWFTFLHV